jgi:hypothetical protein
VTDGVGATAAAGLRLACREIFQSEVPMTSSRTLSATDFKVPSMTLSGVVDYDMYVSFRKQFAAADQDLVIVELSSLGGDPEVARMMGEDVALPARCFPIDDMFFSARLRFTRPVRPS